MSKKYCVHQQKNIGNVIFILEGAKTEFDLIKKIFVDILGYELHSLRRTCANGFELHGSNRYSRIVAINFQGNHLFDINSTEQNKLFFRISNELGIKPENAAIYYLYDRDVKSYDIDEVRSFVQRYQDPFGTAAGDQGQLLLSYPSLESYTVSCFRTNTYSEEYELGKDLKTYAAQRAYTIQMIRKEEHLLHASEEMDLALHSLGINEYDLDNLGKTLLQLYDAQQRDYLISRRFHLVSTLSMALLELGILEEI